MVDERHSHISIGFLPLLLQLAIDNPTFRGRGRGLNEKRRQNYFRRVYLAKNLTAVSCSKNYLKYDFFDDAGYVGRLSSVREEAYTTRGVFLQ